MTGYLICPLYIETRRINKKNHFLVVFGTTVCIRIFIFRPGGLYGDGDGHYGHGGGNPDILTGPVPSWVKVPPFKQFDTCKCTEKFNCKSPGISYVNMKFSKDRFN